MANHSDTDSWGSLFVGLVLGAAIGAGLSLLFAPKSGKETREEVGKRLDELKDYVDQTTRDITQTVKDRLAEAKNDLAQAVDGARAAAAEQAAKLSRRTDNA